VVLFPAGADISAWPLSLVVVATTQPSVQCVLIGLSMKVKGSEVEDG
jgi:hypothetical protein